MALVINSNIQSLNSQRQLDKSGMEMSTAMERLSSGKRINSAADDAAGLAISNRLTSQVRGLDRAIANAADGVSLIQTAEGALDESTNILQRMRELSIQSANGIYNDGDRATLDAEVQQLVQELDRIAETTSFNGQNILDGSLPETALQVGSEANQTISFSIDAMDSDTLGLGSTSSDLSGDRFTVNSSISEGAVKINGVGLGAITDLQVGATGDTSLQDVIDDINTNVDGVTASGFNVVEGTTTGSGALDSDDVLRITVASTDNSPATNYDITGPISSLEELASTITDKTGGTVSASVNDEGRLVLSNTTGGAITVGLDGNGAGTFTAADEDTATKLGIAGTGVTFQGQLSLTSDDGSEITITKGANGTDADLAALGFRETTGAGEVLGGTLAASAQDDTLAAGDLLINGVDIGVVTSVGGLGGKIDAINAVSDQTGVTASIVADQSYTVDASASVELANTSGGVTVASTATVSLNGDSLTITSGDSNQDIAATINASTSEHGVTAYTDDDGDLHIFSTGPINIVTTSATIVAALGLKDDGGAGNAVASGTSEPPVALTDGSLKINNTEVTLSDIGDLDQVVADINAAQGSTGVRAAIDENGQLALTGTAGVTLEVGNTNGLQTSTALGLGFTDADDDGSLADNTISIDPRIKLDSANDQPISIEVKDAAVTTATGFVDQNTDLSSTVTGNALSSISVATQAGAQNAIESIDNALETINDTRSELGAVNNRLEFTMSNLANVSEKTAASRSRIMDADFAAETAALSRAQVLQQASQAMLAQANAAPQQVLSLLR